MEGKKTLGRPREMLLYWLNNENKMNYLQLKTELTGVSKPRICPEVAQIPLLTYLLT